MIGSICSEPNVLEVTRIVNIIILGIRIVVPIILIVSLMFGFAKAITNNDNDALEKAKKTAISKAIAAVLIFFIPYFVSLIVGITNPNTDYKNCLTAYSRKEINDMFNSREEELVVKAEKSTDINDYNTALIYLNNIKDTTAREGFSERLKSVKAIIDERNKEKNSPSNSTGYGKNIPVTPELTAACNYIFNENTAKVKLSTCDGQHQYANPDADLPGGAYFNGTRYYAKESISFAAYRRGLFFGEINFHYEDAFLQTFAIMYTTVILKNTLPGTINSQNALNDINYRAGNCTQNFRYSLYKDRYESGQYKAKIDEVMDATRYFLLVNTDGSLTDVRYNTSSKIVDAMEKASKEGKDLLGMVEALKDNHTLKNFYKDAQLYDCRNLNSSSEDNTPNTTTDKNIIYAGDSRFVAFEGMKSSLGFNDSKETIYAKVSTGYDQYFKEHMNSAKSQINNNKDKTYAIAVNYGVNSKGSYKSFCDYYEGFMKDINNKNALYLISVNPINESNVSYYRSENTNAKVETFNNYMKNTCINQIKTNVPGSKVYYCDIYGSLPISEWISRGYISGDGIHYTNEGSKYIYTNIKKCIANNN